MTEEATMELGTPEGSESEFFHPTPERKPAIHIGRNDRAWLRNWPVTITACFAVIWSVHRAMVQSITLDEANTFRYWVAEDWPSHWIPQANNHVLNSTLMRLFIWLFGLSHLTVRAPALVGGAIYTVAIYGFCTLLSRDRVLSWALFVCFVYNPFIMDYLVAARGYGLALGFLGLAMYVLARALVGTGEPNERKVLLHAKAISACAAISFCANFSFAYANAFLVAAFFAWACLEQRKRGGTAYARLALACMFPAVVVMFALAGSVLTRFPREQLFWGTHSLAEMWQDIRNASFAELNDYLVNPLLAHFLRIAKSGIVIAAVVTVTGYFLMLLLTRRLQYFHGRSRLRLAGSLAAVLALTLVAHWLQFRWLKIPLPYERTSLFFVPLATAVAGAVLSVAASNLPARIVRGSGVAVLCLAGVYFIGALRDSYFREWKICADLEDAFPVILDLSRRAGVHEVPSDPNYPATLIFYRTLYKVKDLEFPDIEKMPPGRLIYVLPEHQYADFIRTEGLEVAYHGHISDLVVAIRPGSGRPK